jgi:hypothetical protein
MKPFTQTDKQTQDVINGRYKVINPNNTFVDDKARVFEKIGSSYVSCTLKRNAIVSSGFHNPALRKQTA